MYTSSQVTVIHPQLSVEKGAVFGTGSSGSDNPESTNLEEDIHHQDSASHSGQVPPHHSGPLSHHNPQPVPAHAKISSHHVELKPAHTVNDVYFTSNVMEGAAVNSAGMVIFSFRFLFLFFSLFFPDFSKHGQ